MLIQRKTRSIRYQWNIISQGFKLKLLRFTLHRRFLVGTPKPALCGRPAEVQAVASVAPHSTTSHLRHRMIMNHEGRFCSCIAVFVIEVRRDTSFSFHWKLSRQNYDVTFLVWSWLLEKKLPPPPILANTGILLLLLRRKNTCWWSSKPAAANISGAAFDLARPHLHGVIT